MVLQDTVAASVEVLPVATATAVETAAAVLLKLLVETAEALIVVHLELEVMESLELVVTEVAAEAAGMAAAAVTQTGVVMMTVQVVVDLVSY